MPCGFKLGNDYDEDSEDRVCERSAKIIIKTTGKRPLVSRVCPRCADIIERRYILNDVEYTTEPL